MVRRSGQSPPSRRRAARGEELAFTLRVQLVGVRLPVWRRFVVEASSTLARLHDIVQVVMGWTDSHLHVFEVDGGRYGPPDPDGPVGPESKFVDDRKVRLSQVMTKFGDVMKYEYDFGDGWEHDLALEEVATIDSVAEVPFVLAGAGACPPEDVGGVHGYEEFLAALGSRRHPRHKEIMEWHGGPFDAKAFDLNDVNAVLSVMKGRRRGA